MILAISILAMSYIDNVGSASSQSTALQNHMNALSAQVQELNSSLQSEVSSLPVVDQAPTNVRIVETWELAPNARQDRFTPYNIVVDQGDTVQITFIINDTSAHTFTIGAPYNFQINDTVPGLRNDLTGKVFTTNSTNDSPGVRVFGRVGNLTGVGSFVAKYAGVFMFFCVYHIQAGMFGYIDVLPNKAYGTVPSVTPPSTSATGVQVSIVQGSYDSSQQQNYVPDTITVVIGVNSTVTWTNNDVAAHTVTSDSAIFDSGNINPGESWTYTFTTPGTYAYHCDYHPWMTGTVIVKGG